MEEFEQSNINNLPQQEPPFEIQSKNPQNETYKTNSWIFHFLCVFGMVFLGIFFLCQVYLKPITVVGQSMLPTINAKTTSDADRTHCDVVYYKQKQNYTYGDVIIISNEQNQYINSSEQVNYLIKRIIACPGDSITFSFKYNDGLNYYYDISVKNSTGETINPGEEDYIFEKMSILKDTYSTTYTLYNQIFSNIFNDHLPTENRKSTITISENCYFAMGDNRNHSLDSRYFGEVSDSDIIGNVRLQINYGENIWIALFKKLTSLLSNTYILKENS